VVSVSVLVVLELVVSAVVDDESVDDVVVDAVVLESLAPELVASVSLSPSVPQAVSARSNGVMSPAGRVMPRS
jgi:hypothetical protein